MQPPRNPRLLLQAACLGLMLPLFIAPSARADDFEWFGERTSDAWDAQTSPPIVLTNWQPILSGVPDADDNVFFAGGGASNPFTVDLNGDRSVLSASFSGNTGYTLRNDTLTLLFGNLTTTGSATHTLNSNLTLTVNGLVDLESDLVLNGNLTAPNGFTQRGTAELLLNGSNNTSGELRIGTIGNGPVPALLTLDGGTLDLGSDDLFIGDDGRGALAVRNGGTLMSAGGFLATEGTPSLSAEVVITGTDALGNASSWTASQINLSEPSASLVVSDGGRLEVLTGITVSEGSFEVLGTDANGNASSVLAGDLILGGPGGGAAALIDSGGVVNASTVDIGGSNNDASITVRGADTAGNPSTLMVDGLLDVAAGNNSNSTLDILDGALVSSGDAKIGSAFSTNGQVTVLGVDAFGNASTWAIDGDLELGFDDSLGDDGVGILNVLGSGSGIVTVTGTTTLNRGGEVRLNGGTFDFGQTTLAEYQRFQTVTGTLIGLVENEQTLSASTDFGGLLAFNNTDTTGVTVLNNGRVFGSGTIDVDFTNGPSGEIEVINGERMIFTGPANDNLGQVTLAGGQIEYKNGFTNAVSGLVVGNGSLRADAGIINDGTMAFSATANVIGDLTNNTGGLVTSSGGTTTFFDDVVNNGEIRTNQDSFTVYFGSVSGNGDTGTGTVIIEGDLKPGFSPGITSYAGDLQFGDNGSLLIELAGFTPGSEHDQLIVAGDLTLNGMLDVGLLDDFTIGLNQRFDIITVGGELTGVFDGLDEGGLVGTFGGTDLFITYAAGNGNDIALVTAVPEPSTATLIVSIGGLFALRRRR